jgi:glutamate 5-kinase
MQSKLEAAAIAAAGGVPTLVCHVDDLAAALGAADVGTLFHANNDPGSARSLWLAYASISRGELKLDAGATTAILERGASLLPAGITEVTGEFDAGDPVDLLSVSGEVIARGLASFANDDLVLMMGKSTTELAARMGEEFARPAVHRDDLVLLNQPSNTLNS